MIFAIYNYMIIYGNKYVDYNTLFFIYKYKKNC
jgi:hypothetical protein